MQRSAAVAERQSTYSSRDVRGPETGHHFLHIDDFSRDELMAMLKTSAEVKSKLLDRDESYKPFTGKTMSMIFTKPSMRTRLSFETVSCRASKMQVALKVTGAVQPTAALICGLTPV